MTTTPTQTPTLPDVQKQQEALKSLSPLYAVMLHNDEVNPMDHVVTALLKSVPQLSEADATRIMLEAHENGRAVVIVCPLEPAELYRDRLTSFSLGCTIEKA